MSISAARAAGVAVLSLAVSQAANSQEPIACADLVAASFSCQKLN